MRVIDHCRNDCRNYAVHFFLFNVHAEGAFVTSCSQRVFAVIVISGFLVFAVRLCNVPIKAFAATGAFQDTGQDIRVFRVSYFFSPKSIDLSFLLCQVPIFFRNDCLMLTFVDWKLILFDHVHLISCSKLLFCSASTVCNLSHINGIVQYILHKGRRKAWNSTVLTDFLFVSMIIQIFCHTVDTIVGMDISVVNEPYHFHLIFGNFQFTIH